MSDIQHEHGANITPAWQLAKRVLTFGFFIAMAWMLFLLVKNIEWHEVRQALTAYEVSVLALALLISLASYCVFSSFDLLGRRYTQHSLPKRQTFPIAFVCYAFNLNLSSWIGGVALRYRLYSRLGLTLTTITKILSFGVFTNTLGYIIVAGTIFSLRLIDLPEHWHLSVTVLQWIGFALLIAAASYLCLCHFSSKRVWHLGKHQITLPSVKMTLAQASLATLNWLLMASLIFLLLPDNVSYSSVLGILLISGFVGMIVQVPAGLGILETVFLGLLQHQITKANILAALIGYRVVYFLIPFLIACVIYLFLEHNAKKWRARNRTDNARQSAETTVSTVKKSSTTVDDQILHKNALVPSNDIAKQGVALVCTHYLKAKGKK